MMLDPDDKVSMNGLLDKLYTEVPGVPSFIAKARLLDACREFCQKSRYWREFIQEISVSQDRAFNPVLLPHGTVYAGLTKCYQLDDTALADILFTSSVNGESVEFDARVAERIRVVSALAPESFSSEIPNMLLVNYGQAICYGAAEKLVALPNETWTDLSKVNYYHALFKAGISKATRDALEAYMPNRSPSALNRRQTFF